MNACVNAAAASSNCTGERLGWMLGGIVCFDDFPYIGYYEWNLETPDLESYIIELNDHIQLCKYGRSEAMNWSRMISDAQKEIKVLEFVINARKCQNPCR